MRRLGITDQQLVDRVGRRADQWTPEDVASLGVVWRSITNGEVTREEEFPQARISAEEITGGGQPPAPAAAPAAQPQQQASARPRPAAPGRAHAGDDTGHSAAGDGRRLGARAPRRLGAGAGRITAA